VDNFKLPGNPWRRRIDQQARSAPAQVPVLNNVGSNAGRRQLGKALRSLMACLCGDHLGFMAGYFFNPQIGPVGFRLQQFLNRMGALEPSRSFDEVLRRRRSPPGPLFSRFSWRRAVNVAMPALFGNKISLIGEHVGVLWEQAVESIPFLCKSLIWKLKTIGVPEWPAPPGFAHEG